MDIASNSDAKGTGFDSHRGRCDYYFFNDFNESIFRNL